MRTGYSNRCFTVVTARYGWHTAQARRTMSGNEDVQLLERRRRLDLSRADAKPDPNNSSVFNRSFGDGLHGVPA